MASASMMSISLKFFSPSFPPHQNFNGARLMSFHRQTTSLKLSSSQNISGFSPSILLKQFSVPQNAPTFTVFAAKGYKMKTHKVFIKLFDFKLNV